MRFSTSPSSSCLWGVITSYSIHYTKLYDDSSARRSKPQRQFDASLADPAAPSTRSNTEAPPENDAIELATSTVEADDETNRAAGASAIAVTWARRSVEADPALNSSTEPFQAARTYTDEAVSSDETALNALHDEDPPDTSTMQRSIVV